MGNPSNLDCNTDSLIDKWQEIADLLADLLAIPAALIMKTDSEYIEVFVASTSKNNPYHKGDREEWHNLYCQKVIQTQKELFVPNALKDEEWNNNPDLKHNMVAYMGFPLNYPDNSPFGTICILDNKENHFSEKYKKLLLQFKNVIELDIKLNTEIYDVNQKLNECSKNSKLLEDKENQLKQTQNKYEYIIENAPVGIVHYNTKGVITTCNRKFIDIIGSSRKMLVGLNMLDDLKDKKLIKEIKRSLKTGNGLYQDLYSSITAMKTSSVKCLFIGVRDSKNEIVSGIGIVEDVSEQTYAKQSIIESQKQLTIYNKLLDATQELTNTGGWTYDTLQKKIFFTDEVYRVYGLSPNRPVNEIRSNPDILLECYMSSDKERLINAFEKCCNKGQAYEIEFNITDYNKQQKWIRTGAKPIVEDDKTTSIIGYVSDITKQKEAEEKILKLQKAVESLKGSIVITDVEGNIEYANPFFTEHTGYTPDEYMGKNPKLLKTGIHNSNFYAVMWETIKSGKTWEGEICNKKKNGEIFWEKIIISPVFNKSNNIVNFVAAKNDITENKKITNELIKAKERAEESDELKSAFLKNISHEIRTPMNAILGFSELLLHEALSIKDRKDFTDILRNSTYKLLNIIESILTIAQIESKQIKLKSIHFTVGKLMSDLLFETNQIIIDQNKNDLELIIFSNSVSELELNADYTRIHQMMSILLDNAVKFSEKGAIEFGCMVTASSIDFIVRDNGVGFSETKIDHVLKVFTQASEKSRVLFGGLGLGLSICARLIDLLKGKIKIQSKEGKGTEITLSLPKSYIVSYDRALTNKFAQKEISKTILVAEDEYSNFQFIKSILLKSGFKAIHAKGGNEAINLFLTENVDIILMDLKMPGINGMEAAKQIRALNETIPIIAQTAFSFSRESCILAGFTDYIVKPFNRKQLLKVLMQYVK